MFTKEWKLEYEGNEILVVNTLLSITVPLTIKIGHAKLYINGQKQDECDDIVVLGNKPIMQGNIPLKNNNNDLKIVKIYMKSGLFTMKAKICIDEEIIGGDNF